MRRVDSLKLTAHKIESDCVAINETLTNLIDDETEVPSGLMSSTGCGASYRES